MSGISLRLTRDSFSTGEEITGSVILEADSAVQTRGIRLKIFGNEETRITRTTRKGNTRVYHEREVLVDEERVVFGEPPPESLGAVIADNVGVLLGRAQHPEVPAGHHEYEFRVAVPGHWRPSYEGSHAWVRYRVEAFADIPIWPDLRDSREIRIIPPLVVRMHRPHPVSFGYPENRPKTVGVFAALSEMLVPDIKLTVTLDDKVFQRGKTMTGTIAIENMSGSQIRRAIFELACFEVARSGRIHEKTILAQSEVRLPLVEESHPMTEARFEIPVPDQAPASGIWAFFEVKWYLHVRLDIPMAGDVRCLRKVVVM